MDTRFTENELRKLNINIITHGKDIQGDEWKTNQAVELFSKLYYVVDGEMDITIGDKSYTMKKGSLALLPEGHVAYFSVKKDKTRLLQWIHFRAELDGESIFNYMQGSRVVHTTQANTVNSLFERFHQSGKNKLIDCIEKKLALLRILDIFVKESGSELGNVQIKSTLDLDGIKEYIDRHAVEGTLTLEQLAARLHVHPTHFIRVFKQKFGISPIRYVNDIRMAAAKDYLKNTDVPIKTISETMGFDSTVYFSNFFKRSAGMSPRAYRKLNNDKNTD